MNGCRAGPDLEPGSTEIDSRCHGNKVHICQDGAVTGNGCSGKLPFPRVNGIPKEIRDVKIPVYRFPEQKKR
jgi:hypothetical protein